MYRRLKKSDATPQAALASVSTSARWNSRIKEKCLGEVAATARKSTRDPSECPGCVPDCLGFLRVDELACAAKVLHRAQLQLQQHMLQRCNPRSHLRQHDLDPVHQFLQVATACRSAHGGTASFLGWHGFLP